MGSHRKHFRHGEGCPPFEFVRRTPSLPTAASLTLQYVPQNGIGEAVAARNIPEVPVSRLLPKDVLAGPQESGSSYAPSRWSYAPSRTCGEKFPQALEPKA